MVSEGHLPVDRDSAAPRDRRSLHVVVGGQAVSALGDAFANVAMPLLVLALTGSVTQMGVVAGLSLAAQLVGSLVAGPVVDRFDRRRVLLACDWAQMVLGASVPLTYWALPEDRLELTMVVIYVVVVASSVLVSVSLVGLRAATPALVGRDQVMRANSVLTVVTEAAYGVGPAVAGLAVAAFGEPTAIGINALTFGVSALAWHLVRLHRLDAETRGARELPARQRIGEGVRFLSHDPVQRALALGDALNGLMVAGTTVMFIYFVRDTFDASAATVGLMLSLASVGAVAASVVAPWLRARVGTGRVYLAALAVEAVALAGAAVADSVVAVTVLAMLFGFGQIGLAIVGTSFRQETTPELLLGRVTAAVLTGQQGMRILGMLASTALAAQIGVRRTFVTLGLGCALLVLVGLSSPLRHRRLPVLSTVDVQDSSASEPGVSRG